MLLFLLACTSADEPSDTAADEPSDTATDAPGPDGPIDASLASSDLILVGMMRYGYAGNAVAPIGDLDGDGAPELLVGAHNESVGADHSGSVYLVAGAALVPGFHHRLEDVGRRYVGNGSNSGAGATVDAADLDGDGGDDLVIAAAHNATGPGDAGLVYVFHDPEIAPGTSGSVDDADLRFWCTDSGFMMDAAVGNDPEGDGARNLLVGCPGEHAAYVVDADAGGNLTGADARLTLLGPSGGFWTGDAVASAGDIDGDGVGDLLVGGWDFNSSSVAGSAWLILDHDAGVHALDDLGVRFDGETVGSTTGAALAGLPDVDGDGLDDLALAAVGHDRYAGAVYVMTGGGWVGGTAVPVTTASLVALGTPGSGTGAAIDSAGDVDGDGVADVVIGAYADDWYAGGAWVLHGPLPTGTVSLGRRADRLRGTEREEYAGMGVAGLGDVNLDGLDDLAIGAFGATTTAEGGGRVYLAFGR